MFTRNSVLSGTSALLALRNEKAKSVVTREEVKIANELGLHARPAAEFVRLANVFRSEIWIVKGKERFSAKSIIEVLTANFNYGNIAIIEAEGPDSAQAIACLAKFVSELKDKDSKYGWNRGTCLEEDF